MQQQIIQLSLYLKLLQTDRVEFEINGKIYVWRAPESVIARLEAGKKHLLTLTVGKDFVKAGSMKASPWVEGTGATLETE